MPLKPSQIYLQYETAQHKTGYFVNLELTLFMDPDKFGRVLGKLLLKLLFKSLVMCGYTICTSQLVFGQSSLTVL